MAVPSAALSVERSLPEVWTHRLPFVDEALRRVPIQRASRVGAMLSYHLGWSDADGRRLSSAPGGKMLRALLCIWACEACGGDPVDARDTAVAVELVHNFTLVHDDIQDGDVERRHRPTVWAVWGSSQAINAGDALHALAHRILTRPGRHPRRRLQAAAVVAQAALEVIEGQCLDLDLEGRVATTPSTYLRLAGSKTGALFGAALESGAIMGGATPATSAGLRAAGRLLGGAFQVRDDWLGVWGDPMRTGKPRGGDIARRKLTYPVVAAYAGATPSQRRELRRLFGGDAPGATARITSLLDGLEAGARTAAVATELAGDAATMAARAGIPHARVAEFADLADFAAERER